MDFVAVPAGTTPDQALLIRGSDHDLELATADPFIAVAVLAWAWPSPDTSTSLGDPKMELLSSGHTIGWWTRALVGSPIPGPLIRATRVGEHDRFSDLAYMYALKHEFYVPGTAI